MQIRASVVVMTFNRPASLRRCLESLEAQSLDRHEYEVVVVDASATPVCEIVAEFSDRLNLVHHVVANLGVAGNRNIGAAAARGETLAFLDDDCVASSGWLGLLVEAVEHDSAVLTGGPAVHPYSESAAAAAGQVITEAVDAFFNPPNQAARFIPGLNFALARERFLAIGGCDVSFGLLAAEDRDFADRWLRAGGRLLVCQGAEVRHEHRSSLRGFARQYFNYGRGALLYHQLRRERRHGRMIEDARLHLGLQHYLRRPMGRLSPVLRAKVFVFLCIWQLANLAGFCFQSGLDTLAARKGGRNV
jgi:GT2 family glycosyltransferase